ncbi:hypothetical protein Daesc_000440 [Daldinia eschscholtzii]|uniref:Uncharacterized protein n=1 Tax=Daldinia eschscholtzii TaxID=292717 RepID=A0AAX6MZ01_9PEZI
MDQTDSFPPAYEFSLDTKLLSAQDYLQLYPHSHRVERLLSMAGEQNLEDHGKHRVVPPKPPPRPPTPDPPYKQDPPLYATHLWKCSAPAPPKPTNGTM